MEETTINETDQINEADGTAFVEPETIDKGEVAFDEAPELVDVVSSDDDDDEDEIIISPYDRKGKWYVLHSYAGYENRVQQNIETRMRSMNVEERIHEIVVLDF